jgi:hypothetical protein
MKIVRFFFCFTGFLIFPNVGLIDGGERLKKMEWKDVRGWLAVVSKLIEYYIMNNILI